MPDQKMLIVTDERRKPYTRVIKTVSVTFICQECGQEVTEEQYPGGAPRYCFGCIPIVRARQNAERVRRFRERQREQR